MFQPPFEMENGGHNMSSVNNFEMVPFDENDPEVIARRIKNRERQRRYRARKRQAEDLKQMISPPSQLPVTQTQEQEVNRVTPVNFVTRVYSQRNWKKDARRAHLLKQQQQQNVGASCTSSAAGIDMQISGNQSNVIVDDTRQNPSTQSGRNWKAEARNKRI